MTPRKDEDRATYLQRMKDYDRDRRPGRNGRKRAWPAVGPSGTLHSTPAPQVGPGLELNGQSVLVGATGELRQRWDKSHVASAPPEFEPVPPGHLITKTTTAIGPDGLPRLQYITSKPEQVAQWDAFWKACESNAKNYQGIALTTKPPSVVDSDLWTVYPIADAHIGLLSWHKETGGDFNLAIAVRELLECVKQLVASAPPSDRATLLNLGDFFHAQDDQQVTPRGGFKLDVDSRFPKIMDAGHDVLRAAVDLALQRHKHVTIANLPGNHDPRVAYELAAWLKAVYMREPRVTVADAFSPFYYEEFGSVLLGAYHGEDVKCAQLPNLMAADKREAWGRTEYHVWHCGHVHHFEGSEFPGCVVEYHNTIAAKDAHSNRHGYRARQLLKAITYHREFGESARATVGIERVRAALEAAA